MSGHSKWSQIKHKKSITDQKKGALFSKIAREITASARAGGPDPATNARLRAAVLHARSLELPKDNIARAIGRAKAPQDADSTSEFLYEALGPDGVLILIEGTTDNKNRVLAEIRKILDHHGAKISDPGAVLWNFEKREFIIIDRKDAPKMTDNEIELAVIDSGAQNYERDGDVWIVEALTAETERVQERLTASGLPIKETNFGYRAKTKTALSPTGQASLTSLVGALSDHDDIEEVYTNAQNP